MLRRVGAGFGVLESQQGGAVGPPGLRFKADAIQNASKSDKNNIKSTDFRSELHFSKLSTPLKVSAFQASRLLETPATHTYGGF